jgi:hypothetical protein
LSLEVRQVQIATSRSRGDHQSLLLFIASIISFQDSSELQFKNGHDYEFITRVLSLESWTRTNRKQIDFEDQHVCYQEYAEFGFKACNTVPCIWERSTKIARPGPFTQASVIMQYLISGVDFYLKITPSSMEVNLATLQSAEQIRTRLEREQRELRQVSDQQGFHDCSKAEAWKPWKPWKPWKQNGSKMEALMEQRVAHSHHRGLHLGRTTFYFLFLLQRRHRRCPVLFFSST